MRADACAHEEGQRQLPENASSLPNKTHTRAQTAEKVQRRRLGVSKPGQRAVRRCWWKCYVIPRRRDAPFAILNGHWEAVVATGSQQKLLHWTDAYASPLPPSLSLLVLLPFSHKSTFLPAVRNVKQRKGESEEKDRAVKKRKTRASERKTAEGVKRLGQM